MKRVYFIANSYDGAYFVLTDNVEDYFQRMAAYVLNLEQSAKLNNYSFGSVEMTQKEYDNYKTEAQSLEQSQINKTKEMEDENIIPNIPNIHKEEPRRPMLEAIETDDSDMTEDEDNLPIPPKRPLPSERPHLRLV